MMNRLTNKIKVIKSSCRIGGLTLICSMLMLTSIGTIGMGETITKSSQVMTSLPKKGDQTTIWQHTPLFAERLSSNTDLHELKVIHYSQQAEELMVTMV
ncbi:hypothetical protein D3C80_1582350 [compost metagenome]